MTRCILPSSFILRLPFGAPRAPDFTCPSPDADASEAHDVL